MSDHEHVTVNVNLNVRFASMDESTKHTLAQIINQGRKIMAALDELATKVAANKDVTDSAILLLNGLKAKLDAAIASGDPVKIQALSDSLGTETQTLADAVTANTPADPDAP